MRPGAFTLCLLSLCAACATNGDPQFRPPVDAGPMCPVNAFYPPASDALATSAPTFGGVTAAMADTAYSLRLTWNAASDDITPPDQIEYRAFVATASQMQDFTLPQSFIMGTTNGVVGGLMPGTQYFVVVRAVNMFGNIDANTVEMSARTLSPAPAMHSLAGDIVPKLKLNCTDVNRCHSSTGRERNMIFDTPMDAYMSLVGRCALEHPELERVRMGDSGRSYMVRKILGYLGPNDGDRMPRVSQGFQLLSDGDISLIREWIDQGAPNN